MTALEHNALGGCPKCGDQDGEEYQNVIELDTPDHWDEEDVYISAFCECGETWTEWYTHVATQYTVAGETKTVGAH